MATQVLMPQFGESVVEGIITRWLKQVGDPVEMYEALVEVNTDKIDTEIPSPAEGILLDILVEEGTSIQAGSVIAVIGQAGEGAGSAAGPASGPAAGSAVSPDLKANPAPTGIAAQRSRENQKNTSNANRGPTPRSGQHDSLGFISPLVARLAAEHHIDLACITGSGYHGRITKNDILAYIDQTDATVGKHDHPDNAADSEIIPLSAIRKRIAAHMVHSERTAPHVTTVMEADLSAVGEHRIQHKPIFAESGVNLTYSAYFVMAAVAALKSFPTVNSSWHERGIQRHNKINIGLAVALDEGLIVPVIPEADTLSLLSTARASNDLVQRARRGQLNPEEVQHGTFTITNHGVNGSLFATPIINQPQCAILGIGAIQKRPVVVSIEGMDAIAIRPMVYLSLTFDHRILDGATADHFLAKIISTLESWV